MFRGFLKKHSQSAVVAASALSGFGLVSQTKHIIVLYCIELQYDMVWCLLVPSLLDCIALI